METIATLTRNLAERSTLEYRINSVRDESAALNEFAEELSEYRRICENV